MIKQIKAWSRRIKKDILVLYFAYKDKRVPMYAKIFTAIVVAYAFSPIDLIPDFIPILGYLDDIILIPIGIVIALKLIPSQVVIDCREKVEELMINGKPKNWLAGFIILLFWFLVFIWAGNKLYLFF